jgi:hypothetical protein
MIVFIDCFFYSNNKTKDKDPQECLHSFYTILSPLLYGSLLQQPSYVFHAMPTNRLLYKQPTYEISISNLKLTLYYYYCYLDVSTRQIIL